MVVPGFVLRNAAGLAAELVAYGARLTELFLPDAQGRLADVVLGFDTLAQYQASDAYMGATCGRYGGRIRNGRFPREGRLLQLSLKEGSQHAHGGQLGCDRTVTHADTDAASNQGGLTRP